MMNMMMMIIHWSINRCSPVVVFMIIIGDGQREWWLLLLLRESKGANLNINSNPLLCKIGAGRGDLGVEVSVRWLKV